MITNKKLVLTLGIAFISSFSFAQKMAVTTAYNYNKSFERDKDCGELEKGITSIEGATKNEKTKSWAKTWFYGGNLYFNAMVSEECAAKFPNSADKTYTYYLNALKFNVESTPAGGLDLNKKEDQEKLVAIVKDKSTKYKDGSYTDQILNSRLLYVSNALINSGVNLFNNGKIAEAKVSYDKSVFVQKLIGKFDSIGMFNSALAAENLEQYEEALATYEVLAEAGYQGASTYTYIANIHGKMGNDDKKMEVINKALEKYPTNSDLLIEKLNFLLKSGEADKAMESFDQAIATMPDNASLYYNRGFTYEHSLKDMSKAAADYQKAYDLDPTFFDAIYSLGAMYYNKGVEWNNKASSYGLNETAKYDEATKNAKENFALAAPALEEAHKLNPDDMQTMGSLVSIYSRTGNEAKYNEMKKKLEAAKQ